MEKLTDEQKQNIIFLYQSHPAREVSLLTGFNMDNIYKVIKEKGIKKPHAHRKINPQDIINDYQNGFTDIRFLCNKYNCCRTTVYNAIHGLERHRTQKIPNNGVCAAIKQIGVTGETMAQIARRFGVSRQYVFKMKNRLLLKH